MEKGVMMQYFEWYLSKDPHLWVELKNKAGTLKEKGITAIWMPPAYKGIGGRDDVGYGVYDVYDLGEFNAKGTIATKYGTRQEYLDCITALHRAGLYVYSDIVLNHKMGADGNEIVKAKEVNPANREEVISDDETIEVSTLFTFPSRKDKYSSFHWNWEDFDGIDYDVLSKRNADFLFDSKKWESEVDDENGNYDYLMGADLDFKVPEVIQECKDWGLWYLETCQNDGFRLDAVKHIKADFYKDWIETLRQETGKELFTVGEYWHGDLGHLIHYLEEIDYAFSLFDVPLHYNMYQASHSGGLYDMTTIFNNTLVTYSSDHAVTFVDNHDTQPSQGLQSFIDDWFKPMAYALILLREEGYPCVFYGDYYGIPHNNISSKKEMLDHMLMLRRDHMEGERHDYLDHPDVIGWSYEGNESLCDGFLVLMTNAHGGMKHMYMGENYKGKTMTDGEHTIIIGEDGCGDFVVNDGSLSLYEVQ